MFKRTRQASKVSVQEVWGNGSITGTRERSLCYHEHHPLQTFKETDSHKYKSAALLNAVICSGSRTPKKEGLLVQAQQSTAERDAERPSSGCIQPVSLYSNVDHIYYFILLIL